jgi:uncharacterized protein
MRAVDLLLVAAPLLLGGVTPGGVAPGADGFAAEWKAWHDARVERLRQPVGWLSLSGLHWLAPGPNRVEGLPGTFTLAGGVVTLDAAASDGWTADGAEVTSRQLASDAGGKRDRIANGARTVQLIDRAGKLALRVWDASNPACAAFAGIDTYPLAQRWRIEARWEPYAAPREVMVPSIVGLPTRELAPGRAHFTIDGQEHTLEPVLEDGELFFVFKDKTAPAETYGGGRFLMAAQPVDGKVVLDFNRAFNPPCVFTPYATCPLPLPQNVLPVRVEAGEKTWGHGH